MQIIKKRRLFRPFHSVSVLFLVLLISTLFSLLVLEPTKLRYFSESFFASIFFTANIIFKAIFTFIAWLVYLITLLGVQFFNFSIKYATRSLFVAMWAVLIAYYMNTYLIG